MKPVDKLGFFLKNKNVTRCVRIFFKSLLDAHNISERGRQEANRDISDAGKASSGMERSEEM